MQQLWKKLLSIFVMVILVFQIFSPKITLGAAYNAESDFETLEVRFWENEKPPIGFYINSASRYILETVPNPSVGSTFGEWSVMDLLRGQYTGYDFINYIPSNYYSDYLKRMEQHVTSNNGVLDLNKSTEWSRITLALTALGYNVRNVAGYDFIEKFSSSHRFAYRQGINGPIWEIIALNTGKYQTYPDESNDDVNSIGKMIDYILKSEITQSSGTIGGWALSGNIPDADITAMALQAFAPYYVNPSLYNQTEAKTSYEEFAKAVERALMALSEIQYENGGFGSWGAINAESTVQVIVALTAMGFDPLASSITLPNIGRSVSFKTAGTYRDGVWSNNMIDALLSFWAAGSGSSDIIGGFKHVTSGYDGGGGSGTGVNAMATDQALYGLIAYDRFLKGKNPLYDMTDMMNGQYKSMKAVKNQIEFDGNGITTSTSNTASPYALVIIPWEANVYSWNTKADGTGVKYLPGEKLVMPEQSIKLYAQNKESTKSDLEQEITKVVTLINELPALSNVKREDEGQIKRARAAYEKLTANEKQQVTNFSQLVTIEGKLNQVLSQYDVELQVTNLIQTIDSLSSVGTITADYELAIANARRAYNALTASQRLQITNVNALNILEAKIEILKDQAKIEQETAVEASKPTQNQSTKVVSLINALPTVDNVSLTHLFDVKKARIYYDALSNTDKEKVTNYDKLVALEGKLDELNKEALEKEELEDEMNDYSYHKMKMNGKTLSIESSKSAGNFLVQISADILETIKSYKITKLEVSDQRGVKFVIDAQELLKIISSYKTLTNIHLEISQYDYDSGLFEVKIVVTDSKGKLNQISMNTSYVKITIPYSFFIDGKNLDKKVLVRNIENQKEAVSHISDTKKIVLNLKKGGIFEFSSNQVAFKDLASIANKNDIYYLANRQVIKGDSNGLFNPKNDITRAQFAALVVRALGLEATASSTPFVDTKGYWFEKDVLALYEAGIIKGTSATTFSPNSKLTRKQVGLMMARVIKYTGMDTSNYNKAINYRDIKSFDKNTLNDITIVTNLGIMSGKSGYFYPQQRVTRAEMATILRNTLAISQLM